MWTARTKQLGWEKWRVGWTALHLMEKVGPMGRLGVGAGSEDEPSSGMGEGEEGYDGT